MQILSLSLSQDSFENKEVFLSILSYLSLFLDRNAQGKDSASVLKGHLSGLSLAVLRVKFRQFIYRVYKIIFDLNSRNLGQCMKQNALGRHLKGKFCIAYYASLSPEILFESR